MSDDALDYSFEEELQAARGYREMWVLYYDSEAVRVSKFPDTPEWREAADEVIRKFADDPTVKKVWHKPMGAGASAGSLAAGQPAPINAGKPDRVAEAPFQRRSLNLRHAIETRRVGLDTDSEVELGGVLTATGPQCPAHPAMPVWTCPTCSDRRDR